MKLQLKRSNVIESGSAKEPTAGQMEYGELALNYNTNDPSLFIKDSGDNIVKLVGSGSFDDYWKYDSGTISPINDGDNVGIGSGSDNIILNSNGAATFASGEINFDTNGSADFSNSVTTGFQAANQSWATLKSGSTTTANDGLGIIAAAMTTTVDTERIFSGRQYKAGLVDPTTGLPGWRDNIVFTVGGSATFEGYVTSKEALSSRNIQAGGGDDNSNLFYGASDTEFVNEVFKVTNTGSAEFADDIQAGLNPANGINKGFKVFASDGNVQITSAANTAALQINSVGTQAPTVTITGSGGIQCGGDPDEGNAIGAKMHPHGIIQATRATSGGTGNPVWNGYTQGVVDPTSRINADGSATFAGNIQTVVNGGDPTSGGSVGTLLSAYGAVYVTMDSDADDKVWKAYRISSGSNPTSSITGSGVITSGGNGGGGAGDGVQIYPGGAIEVSQASGSGNNWKGWTTGGGSPTSTIQANGTATFAGQINGTTVGTSDARFKENITAANSQLADVVTLGGMLKNYDWNDDAPVSDDIRAQRQLGLVAQDVEAVCPSLIKTIARTKNGAELTPAVTELKGPQGNVIREAKAATYEQVDDSYKGYSSDALMMKMLGAIAELQAEVEALKAG